MNYNTGIHLLKAIEAFQAFWAFHIIMHRRGPKWKRRKKDIKRRKYHRSNAGDKDIHSPAGQATVFLHHSTCSKLPNKNDHFSRLTITRRSTYFRVKSNVRAPRIQREIPRYMQNPAHAQVGGSRPDVRTNAPVPLYVRSAASNQGLATKYSNPSQWSSRAIDIFNHSVLQVLWSLPLVCQYETQK